jgi:hypothetical protein
MLQQLPFPIRVECPPGLCVCERDVLIANPAADQRILMLTKTEEKKLLEHLEAVDSYARLQSVIRQLHDKLGITLRIFPGPNEVHTVRGLIIQVPEFPGLCRKTRQAIPTSVRRCLEAHPEIIYAILDESGLFGEN